MEWRDFIIIRIIKAVWRYLQQNKRAKSKRQPIPELFQNRNVLRYEQRHKDNLSKTFNVEYVTASMLYDEMFYKNVIDKWGQITKQLKKYLIGIY